MTTMHFPLRRGRLAMLSAVVLAAGIAGRATLGRGGDSASHRAAAENGEKGNYVGAKFCGRCHEHPLEGDSTDYVCLTEFVTWRQKDKHSQAYRVLTEERSQQMGKILGCKVETDARCLNCHAANVPKKMRSNNFDIRDGVSCDACHGPGSLWIVPHADETWRTTPIAEKEELGMRNVRDAVVQARLCASCHVGSIAEGKVVTHEMYAAGHPPLPSIEIGAFCEQMPPHWRYRHQKPESLQKKIQAAYKIPPDERERTKRTVIGAVVTFQAAMELLGQPRGELGLDFANYDCYACHHELKTPSWRQKRGYAGKPGRLPMHAWPTVLLQDTLRYADDPALSKEHDALLKQLREAFDAQPFGDTKKIAKSAGQLRQWADRLLQRLRTTPYDTAASRRLLRNLCTVQDAAKYDYSSARQKAWAIESILNELEPPARVEKNLAELRRVLKLELPSGTKRQILPELKDNMRILNDYEPERFKAALEKLRPLLPHE